MDWSVLSVCIVGRALRSALSVVCAAALVAACAAPTLPLPPPAIPIVTNDGLPAGQVRLSCPAGCVEPSATVVFTNPDTRVPLADRASAVEADPTGAWTKVVFADHGDVVSIVQWDSEGNLSPSIQVQIP